MKNAAAVGMPVGVYIYSQATTTAEAKKEAQFCLNAVKGLMKRYDATKNANNAAATKITIRENGDIEVE